jgi:hypothetical protein
MLRSFDVIAVMLFTTESTESTENTRENQHSES